MVPSSVKNLLIRSTLILAKCVKMLFILCYFSTNEEVTVEDEDNKKVSVEDEDNETTESELQVTTEVVAATEISLTEETIE